MTAAETAGARRETLRLRFGENMTPREAKTAEILDMKDPES